MRGALRRRLFLAAVAAILVPVMVVVGLILADWTEVRHRAPDPLTGVALAIDHGDRLHYVGHLVLGRALDLCACADDLAAEQYERAAWHVRTARQLALITSGRPQAPVEWAEDGAGAIASGVRWGERGSLWVVKRLARSGTPSAERLPDPRPAPLAVGHAVSDARIWRV
jgi:hypothetical protein